MPPLEGATEWINGGPVGPASLAGRPALVHFWALSCPGCHDLMPAVVQWEQRYSPRGLQVVAVHQPRVPEDDDPAAVRRAAAEMGLAHPIAVDGDRRIAAAWENRFLPAFYLFDGAGRLAHYQAGIRGQRMLQQAIERVLAPAG